MTDAVQRLAPVPSDRYRLERELGQGGMATVYLAHDLKHDRKVAIKVLRPELAAVIGAERFLREIKTIANLQHPHILGLIDSGEASGTAYYVMPFVEGETLRDRLTREKQLPIADAVRIATEVASALDYAHRHGVIHRDIKPENILLHDGQALVADFGIALALSTAGGTRMTETGMSLGTPHYMSPEQAMGEREITARSDIYALGAMTYEMLVGEPPFTGPTAQAIIAKVMTTDPVAPTALRRTVPVPVEAAVLTALQKLPADRFATAAEFSTALRASEGTPARGVSPAERTVSGRAARVAWPVAMAAVLVVAAWGWLRPGPPARTNRFVVMLENQYEESDQGLTLSPDDRTFLYSNEQAQLVLRSEASAQVTVIPGSDNGWSPFYSPDGSAFAFINGFPGALKVMDLRTMAVRTVVRDSAVGYGGAWSDDGWLYYTAGLGRTLMRVRPDGGSPELVRRADSAKSELVFRWPHLLPGGKALLMTLWRRQGPPDIVHLDLRSGQLNVLANGLRAWLLPGGHLVVVRGDGVVSVARFSSRKGTIQSPLLDVEHGVRVVTGGTPIVEVSPHGTLVYGRTYSVSRLVRVNRVGQVTVVDPALTGEFRAVELSPDGSRAAVSLVSGGRIEIWVKALDAGPFTRVVSAGTYAYRPFWSPDGRSIGFVSDVMGLPRLFATPADGGGTPEPLAFVGQSVDEGFWTRDRQWLILRAGSGAGRDIYGLRQDGAETPVPLAATEVEEYSPTVSPDGRWIAYGSDGSGQDEIFVRPFPSSGGRRFQVSVAGGQEPVWANSGRELFYRDLAGNLVALGIAPGPEFRVGSRRALFSTSGYHKDTRHHTYAVSPDGESFYFVEKGAAQSGGVVLVRNWLEEVKAKLRARP